MKKVMIYIGYGIAFCVILGLMFLLSLISPYNYEWDPVLMQLDSDKLIVLRFFWIIILFSNTVLSFVAKYFNRNNYFFLAFILLGMGSLLKVVWLFFI